MISDFLSVTNHLKIKAFHSLDHSFLISVFKKMHLEKISLIGSKSKYCYISKNRLYWTMVLQQIILILKKVLFKVIRIVHICLFLQWKFFLTCQKTIPWQNILKFLTVFLYTVYADDSTFFLKDLASVKNLLDVFSHYSKYSGLQLIFSKCEITGIGSLKGVEVAVCGIKFVKLKVNTIRILGIHFSYNNKLNLEKKFLTAMSNI